MVGLSMANSTVGGVFRRSRLTETCWLEGSEPMPVPVVAPTRSSPAQKALPVPVSTTTRTSGSSLAWTSRAVSWWSMGPEMVFSRSGRFKVRVAMPSETS